MECDVLSSRSNSPDIFFNNFLDEEESDGSESDRTDFQEVQEHRNAELRKHPPNSLETNGGSNCPSPKLGILPSSSVEEDTNIITKHSEESTPIAIQSDTINDAGLQDDFEDNEVICENHAESDSDISTDLEDEIASLHVNGLEYDCSADSPLNKETIVDLDVNMELSPTSEKPFKSNMTDMNTVLIGTKATRSDAIAPSSPVLAATANDFQNDPTFKSTDDLSETTERELSIDCSPKSTSVHECTCATHGIGVSFEQVLHTVEAGNDVEQMDCSMTSNKDDGPQLQDYMVGLVAGNVEDTIGGHSIARRKTERLATRLPRIYHTRESNGSERSRLRTKRLMQKGSESSMPKTPMMILSEYAKEKHCDLSYVMENAEQLGLDAQFPCMQCYDQHEKSSLLGTMMQSMYGYKTKQPGDNRCTRCGAEKMNMATFSKMLLQLKKTFKDMGLIVRDVSSDGNCLFAAIVDQLRVRGDFRYTQENLRLAAVEYLRNNPTADDGTPYALFLSGETWEQYLYKMSQDGEWGDHMVLSAISNVLNKTIIIFGGRTGEGQTQIVPKDYSRNGNTYNPSEAENEHSVDSLKPNDDSDLNEGDKKKELKNNSKKEEDKHEGKAKEPPKYDETCLYLGHIGESHYVSLRRKEWRKTLEQGLKAQLLIRKKQTTSRTLAVKDTFSTGDADSNILDDISLQPLYHLNLMVKQILQGDYIKSLNAEFVERMESCLKSKMVVCNFVGDQINKLSPYVIPVKCIFKTGSKLFADEAADNSNKEESVKVQLEASLFVTTQDTDVVDSIDVGRKFDLVLDKVCDVHDIVRLQPVNPSAWTGRTSSSETGKTGLNSFSINIELPVVSITNQMTLAFHTHWPDKVSEWRTRTRASGWPNSRTVETVVSEGVHIVPIELKEQPDVLDDPDYALSVQDDKSLWLVSFAAAEKEIVRFLPDSTKTCFLLFKLLVDSFLKEDGGLPGSCLKHLFFHACENLEAEKWKKEPGTCLIYLLHKLTIGLKTKLPHYFAPQKNLMQSISNDKLKKYVQNIELLCSQPLLGIFLLMDENDLDITELGPLLDDIFEDVSRFSNHRDILRSAEESFVPGLYCLLQDYVLQNDYANAMKTVNELLELLGMPDSDDCLVSIITSAHATQNIGYAWCLALYVELATNRKGITRKVCDNYPTVPISEVFGPEIVEELGDTVVPECFSIPRGDLNFPGEVVSVLDISGNTKLLTKCLRYYIETFHDMFGCGPFPCRNVVSLSGMGSFSGTICPCSLSKSIMLQDLYLRLFNGYSIMGKPKEFRELIPNLTKLVETVRSPISYQNLIHILTEIGDWTKAAEFRRKMNPVNTCSHGDSFADIYGEY